MGKGAVAVVSRMRGPKETTSTRERPTRPGNLDVNHLVNGRGRSKKRERGKRGTL
jgi:hypothetical protein